MHDGIKFTKRLKITYELSKDVNLRTDNTMSKWKTDEKTQTLINIYPTKKTQTLINIYLTKKTQTLINIYPTKSVLAPLVST